LSSEGVVEDAVAYPVDRLPSPAERVELADHARA